MLQRGIHRRRSIRLATHDYASPGAYFVTICTFERQSVLGAVVGDEAELTEMGLLVGECWRALPSHFPSLALDVFVVMPNHVHGIIWLVGNDRSRRGAEHDREPAGGSEGPRGTAPGSISAVIQNFKSVSTRKVNQLRSSPGRPLWQRNYYEHVIRDERSLGRIRQYILDNPLRWVEDEENPANWRG